MTASEQGVSEKITSTRSAAKLTAADVTPGTARIVFSIRLTQEAQDMPPIRTLTPEVPLSPPAPPTRSPLPPISFESALHNPTACIVDPPAIIRDMGELENTVN